MKVINLFPVEITYPWLQQVDVQFAPHYESDLNLCQQDELAARFVPVDTADAEKHLHGPPDYDPQTVLDSIDTTHEYADPGAVTAGNKVHCDLIPDYFSAANGTDALQALRVFQLFRQAITHDNSSVEISCEKENRAASCEGSAEILKNATSFFAVESIRSDYDPAEQTIALIVNGLNDLDTSQKDSSVYELRLTVSLPHEQLTKVQLLVYALSAP